MRVGGTGYVLEHPLTWCLLGYLFSRQCLMNAVAAHSNEIVLPVPVGDSNIALCPPCIASTAF